MGFGAQLAKLVNITRLSTRQMVDMSFGGDTMDSIDTDDLWATGFALAITECASKF